MKSLVKNSLSYRREHLVLSIQHQRRQHAKSLRRQMLINTINPLAEVWRFKKALSNYNIQYFPRQIGEIIKSLRTYAQQNDFRKQIKSSRLLEDLIQIVIVELKNKPYLDAPGLTEMTVELVTYLMVQGQDFYKIMGEYIGTLLFAVYRYPLNNRIVQKVTSCLNLLELTLSNQPHHERYTIGSLADTVVTIERLMELYLLRQNYQTFSGEVEFVQRVERGEGVWFQNATNALEISFNLLRNCHQRQQQLQIPVLRKAVEMGLKVFLKRRLQSYPNIEEENSQCDTFSESSPHIQERHFQEIQLYFLSVLMEIYQLREDIIESEQIQVLGQILKCLLGQLKHSQGVKIIVVKVVKIMYEQVIMDEEELQNLQLRYLELRGMVQMIVGNDCI